MTVPQTRAELAEVMARATFAHVHRARPLPWGDADPALRRAYTVEQEVALAAIEAAGCVVVSDQDALHLLIWANEVDFFGCNGKPIPSHFRKEQIG